MAGLIVLGPGADWAATGGLFDWTLEFLVPRLTDRDSAALIRDIVDNHLGSFWLGELPARTQHEVIAHWRSSLITTAERELPETEVKRAALRHLRELVELTRQIDPCRRTGSPPDTPG